MARCHLPRQHKADLRWECESKVPLLVISDFFVSVHVYPLGCELLKDENQVFLVSGSLVPSMVRGLWWMHADCLDQETGRAAERGGPLSAMKGHHTDPPNGDLDLVQVCGGQRGGCKFGYSFLGQYKERIRIF